MYTSGPSYRPPKGLHLYRVLIPLAIANIVYVVRQRQKTRLSAIVKKDIS